MKRLMVVSIVLVLLMALSISSVSSQEKIKLILSIHTDFNREGLDDYLRLYEQLNPHIEIVKEVTPFEDYLKKIQIAEVSGRGADLYHVYSLWGVELVRSGILDEPPAEVKEDVMKNYVPVAVSGVTIDGDIWGIPTEIDNYMLVYNKRLLAEGGYTEPPKTWDELVEMAKNLTKFDDKGNISQYGFTFLAGWDSAVVHPFLAMLWSNGGEFLSPDFKKCLVNSPEGVEALEAQLRLFSEKGTDVNGSVWDFPNGTVAMMVMAPWNENNLITTMGDRYEDVGVAPIPVMKERVTSLYTWFAGVGKNSKYKEEAWDFWMWMTAQVHGPNQTTRMGDYLAQRVGAIPSRKIDIENHPKELNDQYTAPYIVELEYSRAEPNIAQGAEIKTILMDEIMAAWYGTKGAKTALDDAARQIDEILARYY
jgi:multiple sugar transport system substrate-binding protein